MHGANSDNMVWSLDSVAVAWSHGITIPILKTNKVRTDVISYKPIAILSNVCELMSHMIV